MAEKRMFTKKITDSDAFIELSSSAQALYFHLNQGADDDGFNNQLQNAMFKSHSTIDDLKVLLAKNFIIRFESGVIVIKHWRLHNTLRKDRYTPTNFQEELSSLGIKDNGAYTLSDVGCQTVAKWLPQYSIDKISIDKINIDKKFYGENQKVFFTDEQYEKLKIDFPKDYEDRIQRLDDYMSSKGIKYKDCLATIRNWARKEGYKFPSKNTKAENKVEYAEIDTSNMSDEEYAELLKKVREKREREELEKSKEIN